MKCSQPAQFPRTDSGTEKRREDRAPRPEPDAHVRNVKNAPS